MARDYTNLEDDNLAACLVMLARSNGGASDPCSSTSSTTKNQHESVIATRLEKYSYACKAFTSHQALGGHKASYCVKPHPTAATRPTTVKSSGRAHECSIGHKAFPSGQALGGHMRKHYPGTIGGAAKSEITASEPHSGVTTSHGGATTHSHEAQRTVVHQNFDLNLPLPSDDSDQELDLTINFM